MTQKEKQLLIKDLCARIPNHVKVELHGEICTCLGYFDDFVMLTSNTPIGQQTNVANVKPYLRPMYSMTEEESKDFAMLQTDFYSDGWLYPIAAVNMVDWLNKYHFDYRGLIPMGLAYEAPDEMYKIE